MASKCGCSMTSLEILQDHINGEPGWIRDCRIHIEVAEELLPDLRKPGS